MLETKIWMGSAVSTSLSQWCDSRPVLNWFNWASWQRAPSPLSCFLSTGRCLLQGMDNAPSVSHSMLTPARTTAVKLYTMCDATCVFTALILHYRCRAAVRTSSCTICQQLIVQTQQSAVKHMKEGRQIYAFLVRLYIQSSIKYRKSLGWLFTMSSCAHNCSLVL